MLKTTTIRKFDRSNQVTLVLDTEDRRTLDALAKRRKLTLSDTLRLALREEAKRSRRLRSVTG